VQFGTFLATTCTLDEYARKIPALESLLQEYHVSPDVAFFLWRPLFANAISVSHLSPELACQDHESSPQEDLFHSQTKYDKLRRAEKAHKNLTPVQRHEKYSLASQQVLTPVVDMVKNFLPAKTWEDISPQFYVTFWSLTLYDLFVPTEAYSREVLLIKQAAQSVGENKDVASSKRKKEQERCLALIDKLQEEEKRQKEHVERVMARLNKVRFPIALHRCNVKLYVYRMMVIIVSKMVNFYHRKKTPGLLHELQNLQRMRL